jgi:protein SCO1
MKGGVRGGLIAFLTSRTRSNPLLPSPFIRGRKTIYAQTALEGRKRVCVQAAFLALMLLSTLTFGQSRSPAPLEGVDVEQRLNTQIPMDALFKNENGKEVRIGDLFRGKPVILSLVYYECPMLCTQVLNGLVTSLRPMSFTAGKEFDIITVSFDPEESPQLASNKKSAYIKDYARAGVEKGWHFLTGSQESITRLTRAVGFQYKYDPKIDQFAHASVIMVVTPEGKLSRYFYGIDYSSRDLRWALVDASSNKIGTLADKLLLYCFHYDPTVGKYSAHALNLVRAGGILTILLLGGFILKNAKRKKPDQHV